MERTPAAWKSIEDLQDPDLDAPDEPDGSPSRSGTVALVAALVALGVAVVVAGTILVGSAPRSELSIEAGGGSPLASSLAPAQNTAGSGLATAAVTPEPLLLVDVEGAVARPGLYSLAAGSRVGDAIAAAGGYSPLADAAATSLTINLAEPLSDGGKVRIPARGEQATLIAASAGATTASGATTPPAGPVDINNATQEQLEALPGVGPVTAQKILSARGEAPFTSVEELRSRGILGPKTYEKLAPLVTVAP
jgi:competence protein ComEA